MGHMRLVAGWILTWLFALAAAGCYAGRDCKPGQACWTNCADNPGGPGCADPWQPIPVEAKPDAGATR